MRFRFLVALVGALLAVASVAASAAGWGSYDNARFAYSIDIPPGFSAVAEADNSDGGVSTSADGAAELRIWGSYLVDSDFRSEISGRVQSDASEGWTMSYDKRTAKAASWSGSKGPRIFYARAVKGCDGAAIYFNLEYNRADLDRYNDIIGRLVKSLRPKC